MQIIFLAIGLVSGAAAGFFIARALLKRRSEKIEKIYEKILTSSFDVFTPQMEIIFSFFVTLSDVKDVKDTGELAKHFEQMKEDVAQIRASIMQANQMNAEIKRSKLYTLSQLEKIEKQLAVIKRNLYFASVHIIVTIGEFSKSFLSNEMTVAKTSSIMAEIIYYLSSIVPILSDFSSSSNEVSKKVILTMIQKFEVISNFSNQITGDIQNTMSELMNENRTDSLAYVVNQAKSVIEEFEAFFHDMQKLKEISSQFVEKSVEKLKGIADIAGSIEDIAETIKVISLNVSVEAANTGNIARGFQVLARDLREFALRTMRFAQDVKTRVKDAMQTTETLRSDYIERMNSVYEYVIGIKNSLETFGTIINQSFSKITGVIETLQNFSNRIEDGIKEVIGQLQYYDIRSQEVEHIGVFIENILQKFYVDMNSNTIDQILDHEQKNDIRLDILSAIEKLITTSSEREILEKYEKLYGIKISSDVPIFQTEQQEEDNIYVF